MDNIFVDSCKNISQNNFMEILNWYRNLYYKEELNTEQGIVAMAINDLLKKTKELNILKFLNEKE